MKLKPYIDMIGAKPTAWAVKHGLSEATVWRLYHGKGFPAPSTIRAIAKASDNAVRPQDWYE